MGVALLTVALPPVRTERGVEAVNAMVSVGPPLFCRGPRLSCALVTLCAQALVALEVTWVTILLAAVEGEIRFTLPVPA